MPKPFYIVRREVLSSSSADRWTAWVTSFLSNSTRDERGVLIARSVLANLRGDGAVGASGMRAFVSHLLSQQGGAWSTPEEATEAYKRSCYLHQRLGPPARVSSATVWHLMPESRLRANINALYGHSPEANSAPWVRFLDAYEDDDVDTCKQLIDGVPLHFKEFQLFATFTEVDDDVEEWRNPIAWDDATLACAILGLSVCWEGFTTGTTIWRVGYELGPEGIVPFVPTCLDADFRSVFIPSPMRRTSYGVTMLLGPVAARGVGVPEIVHENVPFRMEDNPGSGRDLAQTLRRLGTHRGWSIDPRGCDP